MIANSLNPTTNGAHTVNGEHAARSTDAPPSSGRDAHGRFTKGNPGGTGNPFARQTTALHRALCSVVSEEDIQAIALKLKELALAGNLAAIRLLFSYVIGRPQAAPNPDTLDLQEWSQLRQAPAMLEEMPRVTKCLTPEHACFLARNAQPLVSEEMLKQLGAGLQEMNEEDARDNEQHQAEQEPKTPSAPTPTAPRQTEPKPVETRQPSPSPIGGNDLARFASMTPDEILEEIRKERRRIDAELARSDGPAPGNPAWENHATTVTKPCHVG